MYFYTKLQEDKDPRALQNFQRRMLDEGMSANDAWEAYRVDQFNEPLAQQLAEAGVPREEFDKYRTQSGTFDPVEVSRGIAQTKAAAKASSLGKKTAEPIDEEIELLKDAMEQRKKRLEATGGDITKDAMFQEYADSLDKAYGQKRLVLRPPPKPVIGKATQVAGEAPKATAAQATFDVNKSPEENRRIQEQQAVQAQRESGQRKREDTIARAWTDKKLKLTDEIGALYKSPEEILAVANAILSGNPVPVKTKLASGNEVEDLVPYRLFLAQKLGRKLTDTAFEEPENERWGTQEVTNDELLREWAESILKAHKALNAEPAGQQAPASGKFSVGAPVKVGGP
jgi:hypothetical protein